MSARLDGSAEQMLTAPAPNVQDSFPTWSPDGSRLAFTRDAPRANCGHGCHSEQILVVSASGGPTTPLMPTDSGSPCGEQPIFNCDSSPAWSPDGASLAFSRQSATGSDPTRRSAVWVVKSDGSGARAVTDQRDPVKEGGAAWSPDGRSLVFDRSTEDNNGQATASSIYTVRTDGTGERRLTPSTQSFGDHPVWSPDGSTILFRNNPGCPTCQFQPSSLYTVRPDGTGLANLTGTDPNLQYLSGSWSPDSREIVVPRVRRGTHADQAELQVLDATGAVQRLVVPNPQWQSSVRWSPAG